MFGLFAAYIPAAYPLVFILLSSMPHPSLTVRQTDVCNPRGNIFGNVHVINPTTKEGGGQKDKGSRTRGGQGFQCVCNMTSRNYRTSWYNLYIPVHGHWVVVIKQTGIAHSESDYHLVQRDC